MMNDKKSPVQKFLEGKGFYIALALCVAGTGTAAWLAVNRTIDDIDDQNQKILESRPQTEDFTDPGEVDAEQNGVTISSEGEDSSSDVSSSQEPAAQPSGGSASSVPQNTSALQFSLPVAGEKLNPYSDGKLVKDATARGLIYFERDILAHNVNILNIRAVEYTGYVAHICDMKSYFDENLKLIDEKNLNALFPKSSPVYTKIRDDNPVRYVTGSAVTNSLLADGCVIEGTVENCVLFRGVRIKKGAVVKNCVLMQDTIVEIGAQLDCVVTDKNVRITAGKKLSGTESFPVYVQKNHMV